MDEVPFTGTEQIVGTVEINISIRQAKVEVPVRPKWRDINDGKKKCLSSFFLRC